MSQDTEIIFTDLPDSGERRKFATGAERDMACKGRCDLLPWDSVGNLFSGDLYKIPEEDIQSFCDDMAAATHGQDIENNVRRMLLQFIGMTYLGSVTTALLEVSYHYEAGARKYSARNWELGIPVQVYLDSAGRHFLKYLRGDKDEPHDRAVVWNLLGALWTINNLPEMV